MIKITPVMYSGQTGKAEAESNDMDVCCKQASYYCKGLMYLNSSLLHG